MDRYSGERWVLESHAAMIRTAETRSRLIDGLQPAPLTSWLAMWLRRLADRLDGHQQQGAAANFVSETQS
jgi:hypothetical protein